MKIALFGGTFNPLHLGHINILKSIKQKFELDRVYVIPSYTTPGGKFFPEKIKRKDKFKIIKSTIESLNYDWLKFSDYEFKKKGISYTYLTLRYFKKKFSNDELYFIMGDDRYEEIDSWKNVEEILSTCKIIVAKRKTQLSPFLVKKPNVLFYEESYFPVSSSEILKNIDWSKIPEKSKKLISKKHLYLKALNFFALNEKRFDHIISVAIHARRLAKRNFYFNSKRAYTAGITHDLFKYHDIAWQQQYIHKNSNWDIPPAPALHGYVAALWLEKEYLLNDEAMTSAIAKHTLAHPQMSKLDKILYVSDKIANNRLDADSKRFRRMAYYNLNKTFAAILKHQVDKLIKKGLEPHHLTLEAYDKYVLKKHKKKTTLKKIQ